MSTKKSIDNFLRRSLETSAQEVGELLGQQFGCTWRGTSFIRRDDYLDERHRKMILSTLAISGDLEGSGYLLTGLREAITLGGNLILLPGETMEDCIKRGEFGGEAADAFGEVANIIAGAFTSVAIKALPQKVHLKRTEVVPLASADDPLLPDVDYYLCSTRLTFQDEPLGEMDVLLPAALFGLEADSASPPVPGAGKEGKAGGGGKAGRSESVGGQNALESTEESVPGATRVEGVAAGTPVVLIVTTDGEESVPLTAPLEQLGVATVCLGVKDNLREELLGREVAVAILVMREVGELGFAASIKIKSAVGEKTPLITAGPAWTRTTVLQAVKYGACDILITPPAAGEVLEKVRAHLPRLLPA